MTDLAGAFQLIQRGDIEAAALAFRELSTNTPSVSALLGLAECARLSGDNDERLTAINKALVIAPQDITALIAKGDFYHDSKELKSAGPFYGQALAVGANQPSHDPNIRQQLLRAEQRCRDYALQYERYLADHLSEFVSPADPSTNESRFATSMDIMFGRTQVYQQQPTQYYFPGLPARPFYDREDFDWVPTLERQVPAIRAELTANLTSALNFRPYVERNVDTPRADHAGMLDNPGWSALFLWKDGKPVDETIAQFPVTAAAMRAVTKADIPGHSPTVLFSLLKPGVRIPPHSGLMNTRLICHLPLIIPQTSSPDQCAIRVGQETRQWLGDAVLIFDDSIQHEAWNLTSQARYILIFDTPTPLLEDREHDAVSALFKAIKEYQ